MAHHQSTEADDEVCGGSHHHMARLAPPLYHRPPSIHRQEVENEEVQLTVRNAARQVHCQEDANEADARLMGIGARWNQG